MMKLKVKYSHSYCYYCTFSKQWAIFITDNNGLFNNPEIPGLPKYYPCRSVKGKASCI